MEGNHGKTERRYWENHGRKSAQLVGDFQESFLEEVASDWIDHGSEAFEVPLGLRKPSGRQSHNVLGGVEGRLPFSALPVHFSSLVAPTFPGLSSVSR